MRKFVAGNWKMNGSLAANEALLAGLEAVPGVEVALCVPYPYLVNSSAAPSVSSWARRMSASSTSVLTRAK